MEHKEVPVANKEKLLLMLDEHWMILLRIVLLYLMSLVLSAVLFWLAHNFHALGSPLGLILVFLAYLVILISHHWLFIYLISAELSGWAVTEKRIIDFQFFPFVRHDMIYINISEITESEKHQHGIIKNILHYGEVELNLSASRETIIFEYVPYPGIFVETLSRLNQASH